ncbi:MAG TPA: spermidine/putrescine ABC transporter substrate-binding protein [Streptosporangiaceae bacterium]|nr:spermidine/putrescine ABC transporter substrate-binding protein [Streptosporangiaceae bacterium]
MMHPKEGWQAGRPPIPGVSRRGFLRRGAGAGTLAALGASSAGGVLAACSGALATGPNGKQLPLARPGNPVTWPVYADNQPIRSGMLPERNATLKIYNWVAYINPQSVKNFGKKYDCQVEVTTFNTMTEALAKLSSGQVNFDVFMGVTADVIGKAVAQRLIQPLNHSYLPNVVRQAWRQYQNPFYDQHWRYTVPYTIYTTGIAWRKDHIPDNPANWKNGYAFPWQPRYAGKVAILDDYRESPTLALMKNGIYDVNTTSRSQLAIAQRSLRELVQTTGVHIDNNDYTEIPAGQIWIHHAWSGDMAAAASYMPKGVPVDVVGYWFPEDGKGPVANDTNTVLRGAQNPVLAHLFLNYLNDLDNALVNISYNGYMQPVYGVTEDRLVRDGILPKALTSTVVHPESLARGLWELQLPVDADLAWQSVWQSVSLGI